MRPLPPSKRNSSAFEYWSVWLFYIPIYLRYLIDSIRTGSLTYFAAANPGVHLGGLLSYSKAKWLFDLPETMRPKTILIPKDSGISEILSAIQKAEIVFPLILKPNQGERGKGVYFVDNENQLKGYWANMKSLDLLIQEFIDLPVEAGVLVVKPKGKNGFVSSFMLRELLTLEGNGKDSLESIIRKHPRYSRYEGSIRSLYPKRLSQVPEKGEKVTLEPIGNHNRGTIFRNAKALITPELEYSFDRISAHLTGFSFGRFDVKAPSLEMLYRGEGIKVVEVNGVNSEPGHIYDPDYSLSEAYSDLWANWGHIYRMAKENHKAGFKYPKFRTLLNEVRRHFKKG